MLTPHMLPETLPSNCIARPASFSLTCLHSEMIGWLPECVNTDDFILVDEGRLSKRLIYSAKGLLPLAYLLSGTGKRAVFPVHTARTNRVISHLRENPSVIRCFQTTSLSHTSNSSGQQILALLDSDWFIIWMGRPGFTVRIVTGPSLPRSDLIVNGQRVQPESEDMDGQART